MSQLEASEVFYLMAQERDITATYTVSMDSAESRWFAFTVDAARHQHTFVHLSLLKEDKPSGKIPYTVWHFKGAHSDRRIGLSLVEYKPSDKDFDGVTVSDSC
jgi:hypothetical protein